MHRTLRGPAGKRLCLGTCVQTPLPPLLPCLPPFSLLRSLLCHCLSLGKWRPLSPPSPCTGLTGPAWQGQGYQGEAKSPPFCLWAWSAACARRALSVHFATALCMLRWAALTVWARPRHQTAAGAGQGGCEEGSRAGEEGRLQLGLVPGAIRSPGGADGGGGAGALSQAVVGPNEGGRTSDSELRALRQKRQSSLLACSPSPPPASSSRPSLLSAYLSFMSLNLRSNTVREKPGRAAGSHTGRGTCLRGGEEGGEKGDGAGALTEVLTEFLLSDTLG